MLEPKKWFYKSMFELWSMCPSVGRLAKKTQVFDRCWHPGCRWRTTWVHWRELKKRKRGKTASKPRRRRDMGRWHDCGDEVRFFLILLLDLEPFSGMPTTIIATWLYRSTNRSPRLWWWMCQVQEFSCWPNIYHPFSTVCCYNMTSPEMVGKWELVYLMK